MFQFLFLFLSLTLQAPEIDKRDLGLQALRIIGANVEGSSARCSGCHQIDHQTISKWGESTRMLGWCMNGWGDNTRSASDQIECLKKEGQYSPKAMGWMSAAAHHKKFETLFQQAFPETFEAEFKKFKDAVHMPRNRDDKLMTPADIELLTKWLDLDMPFLEVLLGAADEAPRVCSPMSDQRLADHLEEMNSQGWKAQNTAARMPMYACEFFNKPVSCFSQKNESGKDVFPLVSSFENTKNWQVRLHPASKMRIVHEAFNSSSYWVRSSPDGRFIGMGLGQGKELNGVRYWGAIWDLNSKLNGKDEPREILVKSPFDPQFFPDGSGVNYAGGSFCPLKLLKHSNRKFINFKEPECSDDDRVGLYQSIGTSLDSTDSLAISGNFASDRGNSRLRPPPSVTPESNFTYDESHDPDPSWLARSYLKFFRMIFTGEQFEVVGTHEAFTPYDGDWQLSPSTKLLVSRVSGLDVTDKYKQLGYRVHLVERRSDSNEYSLQPVAQFCAPGGKATFSYDDRFLVYHHYIVDSDFEDLGFDSKDNLEFQAMMKKGVSNIYVHDLATGISRRITLMQPGQFALFPHFRNDNWLYFLVKDAVHKKEVLVATDIALYF